MNTAQSGRLPAQPPIHPPTPLPPASAWPPPQPMAGGVSFGAGRTDPLRLGPSGGTAYQSEAAPAASAMFVDPAPAPGEPTRLTYFQLSRLTRGWWRPLAALGLFAVLYVGMFLVLIVGAIFVPGTESLLTKSWDMNDPIVAAATAAMLALMIPASVLTVRLLGRPGTLHSVTGRLRWGLLGSALALASGPVLLSIVLAWSADPVMPSISGTTLGMLAVALLIIPLQAAGEEYLFRGLLMQVIGHWLRAPIWGLLISLPLFVVGHTYDAWGLASVGLFAAVATWLTWRTGGLEAAIALHIVNNAAVFVMAAFGMANLNDTEVTWIGFLVSIAIPLGFAALFAWWWKRTKGDVRYARTAPALAVSAPTGPVPLVGEDTPRVAKAST